MATSEEDMLIGTAKEDVIYDYLKKKDANKLTMND